MATATELQQLYVAYFGRPADPSGLDYWVSSGISTRSFAALMFAQPEFQSVNAGLSVSAQINQLYLNLFGRNAEAGGLAYWTEAVNTGRIQLASIANDLIFSATNGGAASAADRAALTSKTTTANQYTADVRANAQAWLAYQPQQTTPTWITGTNFTTAVQFMNTATATNTPTNAQVATSVAQMAANGQPGQTITLTTTQFSYNGGPGNDTFVGQLNANNQQTLLSQDTINGGGGSDRLIGTLNIAGQILTPTLASVESVELTAAQAGTFDLINTTGVTSVTNQNSTALLTVNNAAASTSLAVSNVVDNDTVFALQNSAGAADSVAVTLSNVTSTNLGGAGTRSDITVANVETVSLTTSGLAANSAFLVAAAAANVNIAGSANLTLAGLQAANSTVNASTMTGALTTTLGGAGTLTGGSGADSLTGSAANDSISGGIGNDTITAGAGVDTLLGGADTDIIVFAAATDLTVADSIDGGAGTNTLSATSVDLDTNSDLAFANSLAGLNRVSNIQVLAVNSQVGAAGGTDVLINANQVASTITSITTAGATGGNAATFTFNSGSSNLSLGGTLGAATTLVSAGAGTSDSLTVFGTAAATNAFNGQNLTTTGIETLTFNTTSGGAATQQTVGTIAMTGTGANPNLTINFTGTNRATIGAVTPTGTGLLTINASGLTAQATGVNTFTNTAPAGTGGTVSIVGSGGDDVLRGDVDDANTIVAAAGADSIVTGSGTDSVLGGAGNDTINANGGIDFIDAGENDDVVSYIGNDLENTDTVNGGSGIDTLQITAARTAAQASNVSNFERIATNAITDTIIDLFNFSTGNAITTALTTGNIGNAQEITFSNAAAGTTDLALTLATNAGARIALSRLNDTTSNALTVSKALVGAETLGRLTVNDEETLTINSTGLAANDAFTITALNAIDVTTLTLLGTGNISVTAGADAPTTGLGQTARTATVNASANTGTVVYNGSSANAVVVQNITGSATAQSTLSGGLGNDTILGGALADNITGNAGGDLLNGGAGNDTFFYVGNSDTGVALAGVGTAVGAAGTIDIISGFAAGDIINMAGLANLVVADGTVNAGTSYATATANLLTLVSGSYDTSSRIFTAGARSATNNDYLFQYNGGATATTVNNVVLLDTAAALASFTSAAEVLTFA